MPTRPLASISAPRRSALERRLEVTTDAVRSLEFVPATFQCAVGATIPFDLFVTYGDGRRVDLLVAREQPHFGPFRSSVATMLVPSKPGERFVLRCDATGTVNYEATLFRPTPSSPQPPTARATVTVR
jgi:hypothetical protein